MKYRLLILLVLWTQLYHGQGSPRKAAKHIADKIITSLKTSDTSAFRSLFVKFDYSCNCYRRNDSLFRSQLFVDFKKHLDSIFKANLPIESISVTKDSDYLKDKINQTAYNVVLLYRLDNKRKRGLDFYIFKVKDTWVLSDEWCAQLDQNGP